MVETLHTFWSSNRHSFFSSDTHVLALRGNEYNGKAENGYYIGQQHEGNTEVKVVKSTERGKDGYMAEVPEGAPGKFAQHCSASSHLEFALCVRWLLSRNVSGLPADCTVPESFKDERVNER